MLYCNVNWSHMQVWLIAIVAFACSRCSIALPYRQYVFRYINFRQMPKKWPYFPYLGKLSSLLSPEFFNPRICFVSCLADFVKSTVKHC
jgi:hypothetical protein